MAVPEDNKTTTETAAERNARLQAAFNRSSTSTKTTTPTYVPASSYTAPATPKIELEGPLAWAAPSVPKIPYQDDRQYDLSDRYGAQPPAAIEQRQYTLPQFGTPQVPSQGSTQTYEDQQVAYAARLTGEAIFQYGQIPNVISTTVANQLPYTYYGYASADAFLKDLGYFEQAPGQWIQGEGGAGTSADGATQSGTSSYGRASSGGGYTGRYAGASTGLINWRIGL